MKKKQWKKTARQWEKQAWESDAAAQALVARVRTLNGDLATLGRAVEDMRRNWRPIPIGHAYEPRNPQCRYCDDPAGHPRHLSEAAGGDLNVAASDVPE